MVRLRILDSNVTEGWYKCEFTGVELKKDAGDFEVLKWNFKVVWGWATGEELSDVTDKLATPENACGKFLACLANEEQAVGLHLEIDEFVGNLYEVQICLSEDGDSTIIRTFCLPGGFDIF